MRAVFTVDLPLNHENKYPDNLQIVQLMRSFGWEPMEVCGLEDEAVKCQKYQELGELLFEHMPATAVAKTDDVIFCGYLSDDYTRFVVLRLVNGQITFRLNNLMLARLQKSTEKMVRKLLQAHLNGGSLQVSNQSVVIYEQGNDYVVLNGRVIPNPLRETLRKDKKSALLVLAPLLVFTFLASIVNSIDLSGHTFTAGTMERMSTALLTTALVSSLSLFETYLEIYRNRIIVW
ncbi:MAG: hypothetical protein BroJett011_51590 [Chloroflexota bacterium]|nr:MAG: hypothetical protein BroJett011_51590 [Chloroflexota bacterium]